MTIDDKDKEEFLDWIDRVERSLNSKSRVAFSWSSELYSFSGEYDYLCETCGRNLPCRHCAE